MRRRRPGQEVFDPHSDDVPLTIADAMHLAALVSSLIRRFTPAARALYSHRRHLRVDIGSSNGPEGTSDAPAEAATPNVRLVDWMLIQGVGSVRESMPKRLILTIRSAGAEPRRAQRPPMSDAARNLAAWRRLWRDVS